MWGALECATNTAPCILHPPCFTHLFGLFPYRLVIVFHTYQPPSIVRTYRGDWCMACFLRVSCLSHLAPLILEPTIEDLSKKFPVWPYGTQLQINLLDWDLRHSLLHLGHQVMKQETPIIHDSENFSLSLSLSLSLSIYIYI